MISLVFLAVAVWLFSTAFAQTVLPKWFHVVAGTKSLLISLGMALRLNVVRKMLIVILLAALVLLTILVFGLGLAFPERPIPVAPTILWIVLVVWTLSYLLRRDVRRAFAVSATDATPNGKRLEVGRHDELTPEDNADPPTRTATVIE